MRRYLALASSFLMAISGCAATIPQYRSIGFLERTEGPVTVSVNPEIKLISSSGDIIAIHLQIKNNSDRPLSLRRSDIVIELSDGRQISPAETSALRDIQENQKKQLPHGGWTEDGKHVLAFLMLSPAHAAVLSPFILIAWAVDSSKDPLNLNYDFKDVQLGKDGSVEGLIFSTTSNEALWKSNLVLRFVDETDESSFDIRMPIIIEY